YSLTMILILLTVAIGALFYILSLNYQYWRKRGVPGPKPTFLLGNLGQSFFLKKSPAEVFEQIYKEYPNHPIVGIYRASTPTLIIRDPEVIRDVTVKSFGHFHDNDLLIKKEIDPLFGRSPFVLRGEEWKTVRTQLTPGFTSGKMKWIYPLLENVCVQFVKFIENQPTALNGEGYEGKELCMRFTLNNVGTCAFGLEAKCFEEENPEFRQIANRFLSPEAFQAIKVFMVSIIPIMAKFISIKFTPADVEEKLTNIVSQTLKYREENNIVRNDFLHILHQLKKTCKVYEFTDVDVTAHAAGFFGDGYETSSVVMSFILYELATSPKAQSILREEINKAFEENDGKIPYEVLQGLPYLDAVLNETLRLRPPLGSLNKICTKPYTYVPKDDDVIRHPVNIEQGTPIVLPLYGLHRDPKYFEDPNRFKPERFVGANKEKITKYSFLPFGEGPRACLGQRFGILQIKIGLAYVIKNFKISVNKKTIEPIKYEPLYFLTLPQGGLWLDFQRRGVPGPKPTFLLGNVGPSFFLKKSLAEVFADVYNEYQNVPVVGIYTATTPTLIIRDPEVIKDVIVKSFSNFRDNALYIDKETDPLFGRHPFILRGDEWKSTRVQLTPGFTSGKMKWIYPLLEDISEKFAKFIASQPKALNGEGYEAKELCVRFTLNNVGSCAFGLEAKCFEEENSEFRQLADKFFSARCFQMVKLFLISLIPPLTRIVSMKFTPKDVEEKLTNIVTQTLKYREDNNVVRNDFLHILQQLKNSSKDCEFTDLDVTAHAAGFFIDGYETSSLSMGFLLYELARNPDVQSKLREEVSQAFEENDGKMPYEVVQGLSYLDGVVNEALRMHPPLGSLNKVCTKPYTYIPRDDDEIKKSFTVETDTTVIISLYGLHRDPKYFEDPHVFKPERFIGENREKLTKYAYLPFGEGPRACLGQRFGILQIKIGVAYVIKNFELSVNRKMRTPVKYDPIYFLTFAKDGLWLDFKKIEP
ncbi:p450 domain containing protein, partial [Asbolus verrucosus]